MSRQVPLHGHIQTHASYQVHRSLLGLEASSKQQACIAWNHALVAGQVLGLLFKAGPGESPALYQINQKTHLAPGLAAAQSYEVT